MNGFLKYGKSMLIIIFLMFPIYLVFRIIYLISQGQKPNFLREVLMFVFVAYSLCLASQTVFPPYSYDYDKEAGTLSFFIDIKNKFAGVQFIPIETMKSYFSADIKLSKSIFKLLGKIFAFAPIGIFVPYLWSGAKKFVSVFLIGLCSSVFVQICHCFTGRIVDIDIFLLNLIGVLIGFGIFSLFGAFGKKKKDPVE